jgi:hypothetical protein
MITLIAALPSVNYLMYSEAGLLAKGFSTMAILIWFLPSVNYLMNNEV